MTSREDVKLKPLILVAGCGIRGGELVCPAGRGVPGAPFSAASRCADSQRADQA